MNEAPFHQRLDHVDGLRAIAVGLVVWFHAQLPGLPQGYLGVDVFFVISGFLITGQIFDAVRNGNFSIVDFYARRVVRILPPLFLVIACVLIAASTLHILPSDMRRIATSSIASAVMAPNWYFLSKTDYFAVAAEREPLLHLWSLGVEEQYYLVAPAIALLLGFWTRTRKESVYRLGLAISAVVLLISVVGVIGWMRTKPVHVFFATPLRAWEFGAGACAILAMRLGFSIPRVIAEPVAFAGVAAIVAASASAATTPNLRFALQAAVVIGSVATIVGCVFSPGGVTTRLLSMRVMTALGLVSYSFYLWHWPGLAFWRLMHLDPPSQSIKIVIGIAMPLILAALTYRFVEKPLRRWRQRFTSSADKRRIVAGGVIASLAIGFAGLGVASWTYRLDRLEPYRAFAQATALLMPDCRRSVSDSITPLGCRLGNEGELRVLLWGDSHALSLSAAVGDVAREAKQSAQVDWSGGCPGLVGMPLYLSGNVWTSCVARNNMVLRWLQSPNGSTVTGVVVGGAWGFNLGHPPPGLGRAGEISRLQQAMTTTIRQLQSLGLRVLVVGPDPAMPHPAPECIYLTRADERQNICDATRTVTVDRFGDITVALQRAVADFPNVRFLDPVAALCRDDRCAAAYDGAINYSDTNHLADAGARVVLERHRADFAWVFGATKREANAP